MKRRSALRAFTLVELSIVLVILGLLVGGVLTGQALIRAAELRSVTTEFNAHKTAVHAFRDKYFALPGDMLNATRFWGVAAGSTADGLDLTCQSYTTPATDSKTCNGNGNGIIDGAEIVRDWQQLVNAGLIAGKFTGVTGSPNPIQPGVNVPASKANASAGWMISSATPTPGFTLGSNLKNLLIFSGYTAAGMYPSALTPTDAWNIDMKMDDGVPQSGSVTPLYNNAAHALLGYASCSAVGDTDYDKTQTQRSCLLVMQAGL